MIDSHAHLTDQKFKNDLEQIIELAQGNAIEKIVCVANTDEDAMDCLELSRRFSLIYPTAGIHPHEAETGSVFNLEELLKKYGKEFIAVGEIGLDYFYNFSRKDSQRDIFVQQLELAGTYQKPVIIHCRDAWSDLIEILKDFRTFPCKGVIHCFTGDIKEAEWLISEGYHLSFGGMLTFKKLEEIREIAMIVPINRILLETDSPYLSPVPFRGKRNSPANVALVYKKLAEIRGMDSCEVTEIIRKNFQNCFFPEL